MANKKIQTIYLQGEGLNVKGEKLEKKESLTKDEVRKQCAKVICDKLSEAFAELEVCKELNIFKKEYAEDILNKAKDDKTTRKHRLPDCKQEIAKEINKAMKKAGKDEVLNEEPEEPEEDEFQ